MPRLTAPPVCSTWSTENAVNVENRAPPMVTRKEGTCSRESNPSTPPPDRIAASMMANAPKIPMKVAGSRLTSPALAI